jgi:hypothetical protein
MSCAGGMFNFKLATAYSIKQDDYARLPLFTVNQNNRVINEFACYCLKRLHELQNFGGLKITSNNTAELRVQAHFAQKYYPIPATGNLPGTLETYFYSKELIAYLTAMLSTVPYSKTGDPGPSITGLMDEEYTAFLKRWRRMTVMAFNNYIVCRMTAYIGRWPVDAKPADAPAPAAAADAAAESCSGGSGGCEATESDDGILMMASDDEAEPAPPSSQPAGDGGPGAA